MSTAAPRAGALALCLALAAGASADPADTAAALLERHARAIVKVHGTLEIHASAMGTSQNTEEVVETTGTLVAPTGLVLVATHGHALRALAHAFPGAEFRAVAKDVRVLVDEGDWQTFQAIVVGTDDALGFVYFQIEDLRGRTLPYVDLGSGRQPAIGDVVYGVNRLPRTTFDGPPEVLRAHVVSASERPRPMWNLLGDARTPGLPLFDAAGAPVGVVAVQFPDPTSSRSQREFLRSLRACLIPLEAVRASLAKAAAAAPEALARARADAAK